MCNEFFLACLYFVIILFINFFLYKLLKSYLRNIFIFSKIKRILKVYSNNDFFIKLYQYSNKEFRNEQTLVNLQSLNDKEIDTLIIGNIYKYIANNNQGLRTNDYYFQLLTTQYLSFNFNLK